MTQLKVVSVAALTPFGVLALGSKSEAAPITVPVTF